MISYKLHYCPLTVDQLTSFNSLRYLCQLQQEGPDLLAGEAPYGAQGVGQGARSDGGRLQSYSSNKKGSC